MADITDARRELIRASTELGRALGLKQGAMIISNLANHNGRVVGTNELKECAAALMSLAKDVDTKASADIAALNQKF